MNTATSTPIAVLGTIAEFHCEPIPYDLTALIRLVRDIQPDLLCLDILPEQWEHRDFSALPPEYRQALLPLAEQSDIVVVPVGTAREWHAPDARRWRKFGVQWLRAVIARLQRTASGPASVNSGLRHYLADWCYSGINILNGSTSLREERRHIRHLADQARGLAARDPGRRILIAVNVQHCHHLRKALRRVPELQLVSYNQL